MLIYSIKVLPLGLIESFRCFEFFISHIRLSFNSLLSYFHFCQTFLMNKSVLVTGNYPEDKQQSMNRYARLLVDFYRPYAIVKLIYPVAVFGGYSFLPPFLRKYLSYLDKLILFPFWLFLISSSYSVVHIADHGNAYYSFCCSRSRCIVTCHDLLALRAALGDSTLACKTSIVGIWLQRLIRAGLRHADAVVFISRASFNDFKTYVQNNSNQDHVVIPSLNANFSKQLTLSKISSRESADSFVSFFVDGWLFSSSKKPSISSSASC